jgi:hypothetical protein
MCMIRGPGEAAPRSSRGPQLGDILVESRDGSSCDLGIGMDGFVRVCRHDDQKSEGLRLAMK